MKAHSRHDLGFELVGVVLVAAVIGLLSLIGWRIWESSQAQNINPSTSSQSAKTNQSNESQTNEGTYPRIKELGIKIKLSDEIKDVVYHYQANDWSQTAYISTKSLTDKSEGTCDAENGPLGAISKKTYHADGFSNAQIMPDNHRIFKFGDDFIILDFPNAPCSSDAAVESSVISQRKIFAEDFKTVRPDH